MLCCWSHQRQTVADRELAGRVLGGFLSKTLSSSQLDTLRVRWPDIDVPCECAKRDAGECKALTKGAASIRDAHNHLSDGAACVRVQLENFFPLSKCAAGSTYVSEYLRQLAICIEDNSQSWGNAEWQKSSYALLQGAHRHRRIDEEVRASLTADVQRNKKRNLSHACGSVPGADNCMSLRMMRDNCKAYLHTSLLAFQPLRAGTISVAFDGARLGKPAREFYIGIVSDCSSNVSVVGTPQVPPVCALQQLEQP